MTDLETAPDVTIVVACYNQAEYLVQCLESVANQCTGPELIVTDDASTDGSQELIRSTVDRLGLRAKLVFHSENVGICRTFNEALRLVSTRYVAFLAADDWMDKERVKLHRQALEDGEPDTALVYGDMKVVHSDGRPMALWSDICGEEFVPGPEGLVFTRLLTAPFIPAPSVMMRTAHVRAAGGYDEELGFEDLDMWFRLSRVHRIAYEPRPLVYYRRHPKSMSGGEVNEAGLPVSLREHIRINAKHLGHSEATDEVLTDRLFTLACRAYWLGADPGDLVPHFWRHAWRRRSPRSLLLTALAALRLPGPVVALASRSQRRRRRTG